MRINGVANAASADMNRLRKTKGYSSKRMTPKSASELTRIHTAMTPACPMMNAQEPISDATRSAMRSPALCFASWVLCQFLISRFLLAPSALAQQEFAPGLDHGLPVISDDVGRGVGLAPQLGQVGAGADHIDRRIRGRHHPAFLRAEARAGDDLGAGEPGLVQHQAHGPQCRGGDPGAD